MTEASGKKNWREGLLVGVVSCNGVVEGLPGKRNFIFSGTQFLLKIRHIFIGLQVGVAFGKCKESAQSPSKKTLRSGQTGNCPGISGVLRSCLKTASGLVAGLNLKVKKSQMPRRFSSEFNN